MTGGVERAIGTHLETPPPSPGRLSLSNPQVFIANTFENKGNVAIVKCELGKSRTIRC